MPLITIETISVQFDKDDDGGEAFERLFGMLLDHWQRSKDQEESDNDRAESDRSRPPA